MTNKIRKHTSSGLRIRAKSNTFLWSEKASLEALELESVGQAFFNRRTSYIYALWLQEGDVHFCKSKI